MKKLILLLLIVTLTNHIYSQNIFSDYVDFRKKHIDTIKKDTIKIIKKHGKTRSH